MPQNKPSNKKSSRLSLILREGKEPSNDVADWGSVTPKVLVDLVQTVASMGGATRLGYTRDGGAYSVGIYLDDDRETFYCRPSDDLDDFVTRLTELLRNA
jgi:hypothetical protein